ncbi:ABC transporter ATP-binding protein [Carboxydochorda subterranea]|uniref:ABC transporter ATP-binding protein n=1 Tax=Carboxydichorda subterranea TaxID=3109565 RepID=A0ABZ1BXJ9_9FIRM|nr:ABC transporter ATP-binding protein [Limnochorda sp. L945t]WRP17507.1 ABC transporter ATP-binding protein [Limnochorda sp. L945t]
MTAAVEIRELVKRYPGGTVALDGLSLTVPAGSVYALVGRNGAGKTTTLRILMGMLRADGGEAAVLGHALTPRATSRLRARIGYAPERPGLYPAMRVSEVLAFARSSYPRWNERRTRTYLETFDLPLTARVRQLSRGQLAMLSLCLAVAHDPQLLLLDDPFVGLDPVHRRLYMQLLLEENARFGRTVMLSTHDLYAASRLADTVGLVHRGQALRESPLDALYETEKRVRVTCERELPEEQLRLPGVRLVEREAHGYLLTVTASGGAGPESVAQLTARLGQIPGVRVAGVYDLDLEAIFLSYVESPGERTLPRPPDQAAEAALM